MRTKGLQSLQFLLLHLAIKVRRVWRHKASRVRASRRDYHRLWCRLALFAER